MAMVILHLGGSPGEYLIAHASATYFGYRTLDASKRYEVRLYVRFKTDAVQFGASQPDPAPAPTATPIPTPTATPTPTPTPAPTGTDYDADDDGLIEVSSITQLYALRYDMDGDGVPNDNAADASKYRAAYPDAPANMGCPDSGCIGYELTTDLSFDPNVSADYIAYGAIFEGNGFTISDLYIFRLRESDVGLFSYVTSDAVIRNVVLSSPNVSSGYHNVGALVGYNNGGTISNSSVVNATTRGWNYTGALVGRNDGTVTDSNSSGTVTGLNYAGGLVGSNDGTVTNSSSSAAVTGQTHIGGLAGINQKGSAITNSSSSGTVTSDGRAGGLVARNQGSITASSSSSTVTGGDYAGGLVGVNESAITTTSSSGTVTGDEYVGGLVGWNGPVASISDSTATGDVTGSAGNIFGSVTGALTGSNEGTITNSQGTGTVTLK